MEKALHRKLDHTHFKEAYDAAGFLAAFVDGISPLAAALVLLSPFFFLEVEMAYYVAFGLAMAVFFGLGAFLGKISKENLFLTGLKLLIAGLATMFVILLLGGMH